MNDLLQNKSVKVRKAPTNTHKFICIQIADT